VLAGVLAVLGLAAAGRAAAQTAEVPRGWSLEQAVRDTTPTRERISLGGFWRWQPAGDDLEALPTDGWGHLRVPTPWPGGRRAADPTESFRPNPEWSAEQLGAATAAWYQVDLAVPAEWAGRRVALTAEYLHSYAAVYVDGQKVGQMRFPAGEVDLTAHCPPGETRTVSLLVLALPLQSVMTSFSDSDMSHQVRGQVGRRGLCGGVRLVGTPRGARLGPVRVETSVREGQITFDTMLHDVDPAGAYRLRAEVRDGDGVVREFTSEPFGGADVADGRIRVTDDWLPEKLWDIHTPQNQYDVTVSLLNGAGDLLDEALPDRFGFREFWIDGRDFYLNGTRIFLSFTRSGPGGSYERARENLEQRKSVGINFVACGGFGAQPGAHTGFEGALRAADDTGVLVALTQPHMGHYDWSAPDAEATNGYAEHAEFYTRVAGNHPSVVFYATSHNACGYTEDMNPDLIDGLVDRSRWTRGGNSENAMRAQAIVNRLDPSRILYHHAAGNLGVMHTSNFYANWTPVQEMSDWFEHWATVGVKPVHLNEYGVPYPWDWSMYRGWYKGVCTFGSAVVPWEYCLAEWNSQFYGTAAYAISDAEKENIRWEADRFRRGVWWHRWDYPYRLNQALPAREGVYSMYFTDNWRAFRTWGLSVNDPSDFVGQVPEAIRRNNMPLLAYIGGKPEAFTSKDHNFVPGETVEKQLILINNSRETVTAQCEWTLGLPQAVAGRRTITLPTGEQERIPLSFDLPADLAPGQYVLEATVAFGTGETQGDSFAVDVMAAPQPVRASGRIAVFDPKGETAAMLTGLGVTFERVEADADLAPYDVLFVGKGALTPHSPAPDIRRVRDGLKVVVFEQTGEVLERRFGFRIAEYGLRWVFPRVPDHPVLAGLSGPHFWNWRGDATTLPPRIEHDLDYAITAEWCGIRVPRGWRCGNRGNVASAVIEKPASGDFLPILDGGYSLQYASLMEYREGRGMVLFCQTDVTGRTESDPAAETLAGNIVRYVSDWQPGARRTVVYAGEEAGRAHLQAAGLEPLAFDGRPSADQVLVLGPGAPGQVGNRAAAVRDWVQAGGHVLALGLTGDEASALLPEPVVTRPGEHIACYFWPCGVGSPLAGVSPADVHNRDPRELPLVVGGATRVGNGVLGHLGANVVLCQLPPWRLDYSGEKMNIKRTFRKLSYAANRLLANMGAAAATPLLEQFSTPLEVRVDPLAEFRGTLRVERDDRAVTMPDGWLGLALHDVDAPAGWTEPGFDDSAWRPIAVPGSWEVQFQDLANYDGTFLYRVKVTVPPEVAGGEAFLVLGGIDDEDQTFVNGHPVGAITQETHPANYWMAPRRYRLPAGTLVAGENVIALQVEDLRGSGGIIGFLNEPEVTAPEEPAGQRWLNGLYLDVPEEWDDPYRFFRW